MCKFNSRIFLHFVFIASFLMVGCEDSNKIKTHGYIEGDFIYLSSEVSGIISSVSVHRGQSVEEHELLLTIEDADARKQLEIARKNYDSAMAQLDNLQKGARKSEKEITQAQIKKANSDFSLAQSKLEKYRELNKKGYVSSFELEQAAAELKSYQHVLQQQKATLKNQQQPARSDEIAAQQATVQAMWHQLEQQQITLGKYRLLASMAGSVHEVIYRKGEMATAGSPLIILLPNDAIKVIFYVPNQHLASLKIGQPVSLSVANVQTPLSAKISFISQKAEYMPPVLFKGTLDKRVFRVEAELEKLSSLVRPGQPVEVTI